jgi:carbonic anhydrase/acetyltransferase-like protein (isoleucine patch superfamily)
MALGGDLFPSGTLTHRSDTITHSHHLHARVRVFDRCLAGMSSVWSEVERYRTAGRNS